jgi:predicted unusual protein kinase regulating ubiquinone biosynthesis (AarF/ABC1/UbiB family)
MQNSLIPTSTSDSSALNLPTENPRNNVSSQPEITETLPQESNGVVSSSNGDSPKIGVRKPFIASDNPPIATPADTPANKPKMQAMNMQDIMKMKSTLQDPAPTVESVETQVNKARPKSLRMQLRFWHTLVFAVWLFGRLIFWQVYVANYFPKWVGKRNNARWRKYAREFRNFAIEMGGVMIKAGQFASTRADILPEEIIAEMADLQDKVPTIPFAQIQKVLLRELGDLNARYDFFNPEPIAAASLGQAHKATLKNGDKVVVKVQRPNVRGIVYTDMAALFVVAKIAMRFAFIRRRADVVLLVEEFGRVLLEEVSYKKEVENARRFHKMFESNPGVYVPTIYEEHCTDQVITIEDVTSVKIDDYATLARYGINRKDVAQRLMDTYMKQIFEERFFHADPHPGNLFIYPLPVSPEQEAEYIAKGGGRPYYLIFIDFGMTGTLTQELVGALINTLSAVITRDARKLVHSYKDLGFLLPNADVRRIEEATSAVFDEVWGLSMSELNSMDFDVVVNIGKEFSDLLFEMPFRIPQDFVYLGRTVSILSGMATALDPNFNPWSSIQQNVQHLITTDSETNIFKELFSDFTDPLQQLMSGNSEAFILSLRRLYARIQRPNRSEEMLKQIISGEVQIETKLSPFNRKQIERLEVQSKRTTRAFVFGSLLITSTLFYTNGDVNLASYGYIATLMAGVWMFMAK